MFVALLVSLPLILIISLIVFGGGQVFMPLFQWLWQLLDSNYNLGISNDTIQNVFTVVNSTPGVVSTKLAAITGLLVANGQWWGWLAILITYAIFILPAIFLMYYANVFYKKFQQKYLKNAVNLFKPVIAGILIALALQLLLGLIMPQFTFNNSYQEYIKAEPATTARNVFFKGWRLYVLYAWIPVIIGTTIFLYFKKVNLILIILVAIILSFIVFEPWLA